MNEMVAVDATRIQRSQSCKWLRHHTKPDEAGESIGQILLFSQILPRGHKMPRDGAIIFADLIGKLDLLRVACDNCRRDGRYGLNRLIEPRGRDAKLIDWLDEITADCAKKRADNMNDLCGARCPQLPTVL